jgi:hypothetical protein
MRTTFLLAALVIFGCGGATPAEGPGAESDAASDASGQTGPDVAVSDEPAVMMQEATLPQDTGMVAGRNPECPSAVPAAGGPCKPILACDYGGDAHHLCTTRVDCVSSDGTNFKWVVSPPAKNCGTNEASCPASFTALAAGSPCPGVTSFCTYQEGRCGCLPCGGDAGQSSMWACRKWGPSGDGCPPDSPLSGDACGMPNQMCSYGGFCGISVGPSVVCENGYWRQGGITGSCLLPKCGAP